MVNQAYYNFEACLDFVRLNKEKLLFFVKKIERMLKEHENDPTNGLLKKEKCWWGRHVYGVTILKHIEINVPNVQSNKQSGKKNRIPSIYEKGYQNSNKQSRKNSGCGDRAPQNLYTCPTKITAEQSSKVQYITISLISYE